jgi:pimeloyl-ACP methyl ester carboxylesterase
MSTVTSADGTVIAYERLGAGPALILVDGALCYRDFGPARELAGQLTDHFTVYIFDRRGRGGSGSTLPYAAEREIEDLAALLAEAGGTAYLFGCSSGAVLAADAANRIPGFTRLALYEPPFIVDDTHEPRPATYLAEMDALIAADRRSDALKKFMRSVGMPSIGLFVMQFTPPWKKLKAVAPTLGYDFRILGDTGGGRPLPTGGRASPHPPW